MQYFHNDYIIRFYGVEDNLKHCFILRICFCIFIEPSVILVSALIAINMVLYRHISIFGFLSKLKRHGNFPFPCIFPRAGKYILV